MNAMRVLGCGFGFLNAAAAFAVSLPPIDDAKSIWSQLSAGQQERIRKGELVATPERISGTDWPMIVAFQRVNTTAEETMAVFTDYDRQHEYVPMVLESRVIARPSPLLSQVSYKIEVGYLGMKSTYTTQNTLSYLESADRYRADWTKVVASDANAIDGVVRVEPLDGGSLLFYRLYTEINAGPFSGMAKKDGFERVKKSVAAIAAQIEKEKREYPDLLAYQVKQLRKALGR